MYFICVLFSWKVKSDLLTYLITQHKWIPQIVNYIQKAIYLIIIPNSATDQKGHPFVIEGICVMVVPEECLLKCEDSRNWWSEKLHVSFSGLEGAACEKLWKNCVYSGKLGGLCIGIRF